MTSSCIPSWNLREAVLTCARYEEHLQCHSRKSEKSILPSVRISRLVPSILWALSIDPRECGLYLSSFGAIFIINVIYAYFQIAVRRLRVDRRKVKKLCVPEYSWTRKSRSANEAGNMPRPRHVMRRIFIAMPD